MVSAISFFQFPTEDVIAFILLIFKIFRFQRKTLFLYCSFLWKLSFPSEDLIVYLLFLIIFPQILCTQFLENFSIEISHRWLDVNELDFIHFWQYLCRHFQYQFIGYVVDFDDLFSATTCIKSETIRHMNMKLSG